MTWDGDDIFMPTTYLAIDDDHTVEQVYWRPVTVLEKKKKNTNKKWSSQSNWEWNILNF